MWLANVVPEKVGAVASAEPGYSSAPKSGVEERGTPLESIVKPRTLAFKSAPKFSIAAGTEAKVRLLSAVNVKGAPAAELPLLVALAPVQEREFVVNAAKSLVMADEPKPATCTKCWDVD